MARGRKSREVLKEERFDPTPETLAKLEADPLKEMMRAVPPAKPLIGVEEERAAYEIRAVFMAVCKGLFRKGQVLGEEFGAPSGKVAEMPTGIACAHHETYLPWTKRHHPDLIDAVLTVVVDSQHVMARMKPMIADALKDYAQSMERRKVIDISAI